MPYKYESGLQGAVIKQLKETYGDNVWVFKTHDLCRVGVPDILLCFYGHFVAIELKMYRGKRSRGKIVPIVRKATALQKYNINAINRAAGSAFVAWETQQIFDRLERIRETLGIAFRQC